LTLPRNKEHQQPHDSLLVWASREIDQKDIDSLKKQMGQGFVDVRKQIDNFSGVKVCWRPGQLVKKQLARVRGCKKADRNLTVGSMPLAINIIAHIAFGALRSSHLRSASLWFREAVSAIKSAIDIIDIQRTTIGLPRH
jgi:hypothetical protein